MKNISVIASKIFEAVQRDADILNYYDRAVRCDHLGTENFVRKWVNKHEDIKNALEDVYNIDDLVHLIRGNDDLTQELRTKLAAWLIENGINIKTI